MNHKNSFESRPLENNLQRYWDTISVIAILLIITILRFPFLEVPLERDEGSYAYIAQLLLQGISPYTEAYSLYFPGIFIIYALTFIIFGQTIFAIHFGLLIANLLTVVIVFLIGKNEFMYDCIVSSADAFDALYGSFPPKTSFSL